jgi:hypothetical protein
MRTLVQKLKGPLRHPGFVWPGILALAIGITLGLVFYRGGGRPQYFFYAPVFAVCGITLLMRLVSGSLLYVGVLALALLEGIAYFGLGSRGLLPTSLALLAFVAMTWWGFDQLKYHLSRSAKR